MKCPNCYVPLVISERHQVEIDYCPECRGVWLDRGELDKILDRTSPTQSSTGSTHRREDDRDTYERDRESYSPHKKKKREGFLGELFDF